MQLKSSCWNIPTPIFAHIPENRALSAECEGGISVSPAPWNPQREPVYCITTRTITITIIQHPHKQSPPPSRHSLPKLLPHRRPDRSPPSPVEMSRLPGKRSEAINPPSPSAVCTSVGNHRRERERGGQDHRVCVCVCVCVGVCVYVCVWSSVQAAAVGCRGWMATDTWGSCHHNKAILLPALCCKVKASGWLTIYNFWCKHSAVCVCLPCSTNMTSWYHWFPPVGIYMNRFCRSCEVSRLWWPAGKQSTCRVKHVEHTFLFLIYLHSYAHSCL